MSRVFIFLLINFICLTLYSQNDSTSLDLEMEMSAEDLAYITERVTSDVVNWSEGKDDRRDEIAWKILDFLDTVILVTIETDSGDFEINLVEEVLRRTIGGFAGLDPNAQIWTINTGKKSMLEIINEIKSENPNLGVPGEALELIPTSTDSKKRHYTRFYDEKRNEVVFIYLQGSTLGLIGYDAFDEHRDSYVHAKKFINQGFWKIENGQRIEEFERMIVNKVREKAMAKD